MKLRRLFRSVLIYLAASTFFSSCSNDEISGSLGIAHLYSDSEWASDAFWYDPQCIIDLKCEVIDTIDVHFAPRFVYHEEDILGERTPMDLKNMRLYLYLKTDVQVIHDKIEKSFKDSTKVAQVLSRVSTIKSISDQITPYRRKNIGAVNELAAYINGDVKITADKTLFGKVPGSDLSQYFTFCSHNPYKVVGQISDSGTQVVDLLDNEDMSFSEFYTEKTWLVNYQTLKLNSFPEEDYNEIEFTIIMPVKKEYYLDNFMNGDYDITHARLQDDIFIAKCKYVKGVMSKIRQDSKKMTIYH